MDFEYQRETLEIDPSVQPFCECVKEELIQPVSDSLEFTANTWNAPAEVAVAAVDK